MEVLDLFLLISGLILLNLVEFLVLNRMMEFLKEMKVEFDMVIFDMLFVLVVLDV